MFVNFVEHLNMLSMQSYSEATLDFQRYLEVALNLVRKWPQSSFTSDLELISSK